MSAISNHELSTHQGIQATVAPEVINKSFFDVCPAPLMLLDEDGRIIRLNAAVEALMGLEHRDNWGLFIHPMIEAGCRECLRSHLSKVIKAEDAEACGCSLKVRGANGLYLYAEVESRAVRFVDSDKIYSLSYLSVKGADPFGGGGGIAESDSEALLENGLCVIHQSGVIVKTSHGFAALLGYTDSQLVGEAFECLVWEEDQNEFRFLCSEFVYSEFKKKEKLNLLCKCGNKVPAIVSTGMLVRDYSATYLILLIERDRAGGRNEGSGSSARRISGRRSVESLLHKQDLLQTENPVSGSEVEAGSNGMEDPCLSLMHVEQLVTVGTLAACIAHDLNNLHSPLLGYSDMLLSDKSLNGKSRKYVNIIHEAINKASEMSQSLLTLSRPENVMKTPIDLNKIVSQSCDILGKMMLNDDIDLSINLQPIPLIIAAEAQIGQVILNLLLNAKDSLAHCEDKRITVGTRVLDGVIALNVCDTGCGISEDNLEHVFLPFFTTKKNCTCSGVHKVFSGGTGLGLSVCKKIVSDHGGRISVRKTDKEGTCFEVCFPVTEQKQ